MVTTPEQLVGLLASTRFAGRPTVVLQRGEAAAVAVQIEPAEAREAFSEAQALLAVTGRWPLVVTTWPLRPPDSWEAAMRKTLDPRGYERVARASPETILREAEDVDVDALLAALHDDDWDAWQAEEPYGQVDWALAELQAWFEPSVEQPTAIVFLPSPHPWAAVAYECWYAEHERAPAALLVALLKRWALAYGAEPMAHWGTMLQFRVDRPPTDRETARALAREQLLVAPCTAIMPGNHPAHHAEALMRAHAWFLHERP